MPAIEVKNLKKYFGNVKAVDDISFSVEKGEIFGFLGPNGAGKTTTIRCLMDFIRPISGKIKILGLDAQTNSVDLKAKIGYLPSEPRLYDNWTGKDHILFIQSIRGNTKEAKDLAERLDFEPKIKVRHLSSGNKQKLSLILALMSEPEILIMDEPTLGLDPLLQNTIYKILKERQKRGCTIFMSSHNLSEVERICNRVGIIRKGKLVATESIEQLKKKKIYTIIISFDQTYSRDDFRFKQSKIVSATPDTMILNIKGDINPVIRKLGQYKLKNLEIKRANLEEIFLEFYK